MQIKDFLGLQMTHVPEHYLQKVGALFMALPTANWGCSHWHRYPRHTHRLASLRYSSPGASARSAAGLRGDGRRQPARWTGRHHWLPVPLCSGGRLTGSGIPQLLPQLVLPWDMPGSSFTLSWDSLRALLPAAFSMAMLGAIESLLCAVVLDGMTGTKHKANSELVGGA